LGTFSPLANPIYFVTPPVKAFGALKLSRYGGWFFHLTSDCFQCMCKDSNQGPFGLVGNLFPPQFR
jgi:hypothetical protein